MKPESSMLGSAERPSCRYFPFFIIDAVSK